MRDAKGNDPTAEGDPNTQYRDKPEKGGRTVREPDPQTVAAAARVPQPAGGEVAGYRDPQKLVKVYEEQAEEEKPKRGAKKK
jgi:hypothetical protein